MMATKQFEFSYTSSDEPDECTFDDVEYAHYKRIDHRVHFSEDTRWVNILSEFAKFLDSTGYVGVSEAVDKMIAQKDAALRAFLKEDDDEDTSNPGLSD
jgi:hypothetical protein